MRVDQKYIKNGFLLFETNLKNNLKKIRKKIITIFNNSSKTNGLKSIKNDKDITNFSKKNHNLWVSAYDQLRFLPEVLTLSNNSIILNRVRKCGIKFPVVNEVILRADMPNDDKWLLNTHQDFSYYQGSMNAVMLWMPLQDINLDIGSLGFVKGSHKKGFISDEGLSIEDSKFDPMPMKLGEGVLFSQWLVHRSGKNRSNKIRFSIQLCFNDLSDKNWAKRKFFFPKRKWVKSPKVNFATYFPYKK